MVKMCMAVYHDVINVLSCPVCSSIQGYEVALFSWFKV